MTEKTYYVIQNKEGKFFTLDNYSGGYPVFIDNFLHCEKYNSKEDATAFLYDKYVTELFTKEFIGAKIRKVEIKLDPEIVNMDKTESHDANRKKKSDYMRDYLIGCIEADEDLVALGLHKNEHFINEVVEEYECNLKYVEDVKMDTAKWMQKMMQLIR